MSIGIEAHYDFYEFGIGFTIDEIEAVTNAATPAPWFVVERGNSKRHVVMSSGRMLQDWNGSILKRDAEFVAMARARMPDLIRRNRELEAENGWLRVALELIAAPMRRDGTWNRDRQACAELARAALSHHES